MLMGWVWVGCWWVFGVPGVGFGFGYFAVWVVVVLGFGFFGLDRYFVVLIWVLWVVCVLGCWFVMVFGLGNC